MSDKKDKILDSTLIPREETLINPTQAFEEKTFIPSMPNLNLFEELPDGYQINEFGEIVREKGKSR